MEQKCRMKGKRRATYKKILYKYSSPRQAQKMARKPLASLMETKRLMKSARTPSVLLQMEEEAAVFSRMLKEPAAVEAFSAFMEKRKPVFN
jgi:enoyl-CoA hydratase/carnithine racemase